MNIEYVNYLIENGSMPFLVAVLLGLISAVSPCPLTTNISALGYIAKSIGSGKKMLWDGIFYALGRIVTYAILGGVSIFILRKGASIEPINHFLNEYGESILPPILLFMALVTLNVIRLGHHHHASDNCSVRGSRYSKGGWGAFVMGLVFALAFCPINGMFFFGMLAPMAAMSTGGYFMPVVYGLITGLPVVIVSWFLAFSVGHIDVLQGRMVKIEKWCRIFVASMLIIFAGYFAYHAYWGDECGHHHGHSHSHEIQENQNHTH